MAIEDNKSVIIAAGNTVLPGMALTYTGSGHEVEIGAADAEADFAGFALYGGTAGELIAMQRGGVVQFITSEDLDSTDANAALKLAANGELALAEAEHAYIARYDHRDIIGGQGGDPTDGSGSEVTDGNKGFALIEKGTVPAA